MSFCILLFAAVDCNDKASIAACIEGKVGFSLSLCVHLLHQPNWNIINNFASIWSYFGCVCSAKQKSTSNWLSHDMTPWIKLRVTDLIRFLNLKHTIRKFQFSWYKRNMLVFHLRYIAPILHFKSFEHATTIYFRSDFFSFTSEAFYFICFFLSFFPFLTLLFWFQWFLTHLYTNSRDTQCVQIFIAKKLQEMFSF